jgi:hypothetical protein
MKLAAGNPNLKNRNSHSYIRVEPLLMERTEHTATPRTFNHMKDGQVYVPENSEPVRPGAMDALKITSYGYST